MMQVVDWILNWPPLKGYRTQVCAWGLVLLAAYQQAVVVHALPAVLPNDTITALMALLTAFAARFAADHQPPTKPS